jgi:hypothetical protein
VRIALKGIRAGKNMRPAKAPASFCLHSTIPGKKN